MDLQKIPPGQGEIEPFPYPFGAVKGIPSQSIEGPQFGIEDKGTQNFSTGTEDFFEGKRKAFYFGKLRHGAFQFHRRG